MAGSTEFSQEAVRQYILANEGRVTNHDLVKHFRAWLTDPIEKENSRRKFKEYVNTLATISQESGEKYLVLKQKFYPQFDDDVPDTTPPSKKSPSMLDEVLATYSALSSSSSSSSRRHLPPTPTNVDPVTPPVPAASWNFGGAPASISPRDNRHHGHSQNPALPPYRPPPPPANRHNSVGLPPPENYGLPMPKQGVFHPPDQYRMGHSVHSNHAAQDPGAGTTPPPLPAKKDSLPASCASASSGRFSIASSSSSGSVPGNGSGGERSRGSFSQLPSRPAAEYPYFQPPPLPSRRAHHHGSQSSLTTSSSHGNVSRKCSSDENSNEAEAKASVPSDGNGDKPAVAGESSETRPLSKDRSSKSESISVKERTKTFNRMASQVELSSSPRKESQKTSAAAVKRRNSRAAERRASSAVRDDEGSQDTASICTLDHFSKQWMVKAAQGDYHAIAKMLKDDPRLAKNRDFISGYTALHWAAKHGNIEMVKLLAGSYSLDINQKSHGGYTPLHLACQFGHQEVFDFMVKAYGADPHLRDNSGKKPRQYMVVQDPMGLSMSSDTFRQLKDRRRHRRQQASSKSHSNSGILRFGSLSVKVKKTTEAFNNYFNSKSDPMDGPNSLPPIMDVGAELGQLKGDTARMPPPKFAAPSLKKRKSRRPADGHMNRTRSAPLTPAEAPKSIKKKASGTQGSDSDSEYGFDSQWSGTKQ